MSKPSNLKRDTSVQILVSDGPPYKIMNKEGDLVGLTLQDGVGVYLHNVNFKLIDDLPTLEGRYKGKIEEERLNISDGIGVMYDPAKQIFTDGRGEIKTARMVQVYNGIIKVVIK
ncbi:hypothetical protein BXO87_01860 [Bacillus sp. GZB]|uniref:hypothetical protein n=1 Tax=Bacillus TaxID=1386 RepID=UPI00097697FA|nr:MULTISPECIES: hypothetical protein [Bacillus]MCZ4246873.1 hypothetical protein [Bacillus amyloliquefaciens]OMQ06775.1 hypothetical protein BXO87_01860 [Bacillus sp. GZB]